MTNNDYFKSLIEYVTNMIRTATGADLKSVANKEDGWMLTDGKEAILGGLGTLLDAQAFYKELCAFLIGVRFMERRADGVVTYFMWYMFNKWSHEESIYIFGENLGEHIWNKYTDSRDKLEFYGSIDNGCRSMLVKRAMEIYKNK